MKYVLLILLTVLCTVTVTGQNALPVGAMLPKGDVKMKDVSGTLVSLNEVKAAGGLLVLFTCNTCPYIEKNQSRIKEICRYAEEKNIGVILLNANEGDRQDGDSYADMQAYAQHQGYQWKYALDSRSEVADAFGANRTPECFLFDNTNKLVYHGAIDNSPADISNVSRVYVREAINEMVAGKDVTVKESRSVGCTIRRKG